MVRAGTQQPARRAVVRSQCLQIALQGRRDCACVRWRSTGAGTRSILRAASTRVRRKGPPQLKSGAVLVESNRSDSADRRALSILDAVHDRSGFLYRPGNVCTPGGNASDQLRQHLGQVRTILRFLDEPLDGGVEVHRDEHLDGDA